MRDSIIIGHIYGDVIGNIINNYKKKLDLETIDFINELLYYFINIGGINSIDVNREIHTSYTDTIVNNNQLGEPVNYLSYYIINLVKTTNGKVDNEILKYFSSNNSLYSAPYSEDYFASITCSLFTKYAIDKIPVSEWIERSIDAIDNISTESKIKKKYVNMWNKYINKRFVNKKPIISKLFDNFLSRTIFFTEHFNRYIKQNRTMNSFSLLVAYDSLLSCNGLWEKLILNSVLHNFDSSIIAALSGSYYMLVYGTDDISEKMIHRLNIYKKKL